MPRWTKVALQVIGILVGIILVLWLAVAAYVHTHKKQLLESITNQLNGELNGKLTIAKMEPALISGFPGISVSLKNVLLRDSLWERHHHDLLRAEDAYVAVNALSIITGNPTIKSIRITKGNIYLFVDSTGYSNTNLFKKRKITADTGKGARKKINRIYLDDVNVIFENKTRRKLFNLSINDLSSEIKYNPKGWSANVKIRTLVNNLSFNTKFGSFLKDKNLYANLELKFDDKSQILSFPVQDFKIEEDDFNIGGKFSFAPNNSDFNLEINVPSISIKNASALLSPNISSRLKPYNLRKPLAVQANINGQLKGGGNPLIKAYWQVKDNTLTYKDETIENTNFSGYFSNEVEPGKGRIDPNSAISFYQMRGTWLDIPFRADSVTITNLKLPIIAGKFVSNFPLRKINSVFGDRTFSFTNGTASLNLLYQGPFEREDHGKRFINGHVQINDASLTYIPRNLSFTNVKARLNFRGQDLFLQNMQVKSGSSSLQMEGSLKNFLNLYYSDPDKIHLDWNIRSPQLNLNEFLVFLSKRKSNPNPGAMGRKVNKISRQLDLMLDQASVHMNLQVNRVLYKKFVAKNVKSDITLKKSGININNVSLNHAGGSLRIKGNIDQSGRYNRMNVHTTIANANVQELFYAFDNFGQDAITDRNLTGSFNASINASASMKDNGQIVPGSVLGTVDFNLKKGAIINFEPMRKVGSLAFPNRNFSNITFENLKNTLFIQGNKVNIPPMQIESSVLNIFLQGVYGFASGTDIALQIPLRNPKKDELINDEVAKEKRSKRGIVINVRAVDGADGNVKFKLGK